MPLLSSADLENMSAIFRGKAGHSVAETLLRTFNMNKINELYDRHQDCAGPEFAAEILHDIGVNPIVTYSVPGIEPIMQGPFITISNHPCGHIDGISLIDIFGHLRHDYRLMANGILSRIENLNGNFISVSPIGKMATSPTPTSISGLKTAMQHLNDGHPLGIFPSGAVSDLKLSKGIIEDREWQMATIKLIRKARVPIIPVRFHDGNSPLYYLLGLIDWKIRLLRLPSEVFNKRGKKFRITIGNAISVEEQDIFGNDINGFSKFLRSRVYDL